MPWQREQITFTFFLSKSIASSLESSSPEDSIASDWTEINFSSDGSSVFWSSASTSNEVASSSPVLSNYMTCMASSYAWASIDCVTTCLERPSPGSAFTGYTSFLSASYSLRMNGLLDWNKAGGTCSPGADSPAMPCSSLATGLNGTIAALILT